MGMNIREGRDRDGNFAVQIRIRKDDPIAPYIVAAMNQAMHRSVDFTGFVEEHDPDEAAAEDIIGVVKNLLPEDLKRRFEEEEVAVQHRAAEAFKNNMMGSGLGHLLNLMGMGGTFARDAALKNVPEGLRKMAEAIPDSGDALNHMIRPDTPEGRKIMSKAMGKE